MIPRCTRSQNPVRQRQASASEVSQTWTGRPYGYVQPTTRYVESPALPQGTRRVAQEAGGPGFTITYGRRVLRWSTVLRVERFRVSYQPVERVVEVGPR